MENEPDEQLVGRYLEYSSGDLLIFPLGLVPQTPRPPLTAACHDVKNPRTGLTIQGGTGDKGGQASTAKIGGVCVLWYLGSLQRGYHIITTISLEEEDNYYM